MKCLYQTEVIHKPEYTDGRDVKHFAEDIIAFGDCEKGECPFYHATEYKPARLVIEHCFKVESEKS